MAVMCVSKVKAVSYMVFKNINDPRYLSHNSRFEHNRVLPVNWLECRFKPTLRKFARNISHDLVVSVDYGSVNSKSELRRSN